jgi:tetratricopeptide (TPR) repeat protein
MSKKTKNKKKKHLPSSRKVTTVFRQKNVQLFLIITIFLTVICYLPALHGEFTNWDDNQYVTENNTIKQWSGDNIRKLFSEEVAGNFHPLTMLSFAINYQLGGEDPFSYHLINLILHILNSILVFYFIYLICNRKLFIAAATALLFAIHPMHVESVAWISERKDVLYAFFFLLSSICYYKFLIKSENRFYFLAIFLFILSLLSKPAAVILPLVLILLQYSRYGELKIRRLMHLAPFFLLSLALGLITVHYQDAAIQSLDTHSFFRKILFGFYGIMMYSIKAILPFNLNNFYPFPNINKALPLYFYLAPIFTVILFGMGWYLRKNKIIVFGLSYFVINLLLVLQFFQVGSALMAERYTYIPYIGLFMIMAYYIDRLIKSSKRKWQQNAIYTLLVLIGLTYTFISYQRSNVWKSSESLWLDNTSKVESPLGFTNLGNIYFKKNELAKATEFYNKALQYNPEMAEALRNLGVIAYNNGKYAESIDYLNKAIVAKPTYIEAYLPLISALYQIKDYSTALEHSTYVLSINPTQKLALEMSGHCHFSLQNYPKALDFFNKAIENYPSTGNNYLNRAIIHERLGNKPAALKDAQKAKSMGQNADNLINRLR